MAKKLSSQKRSRGPHIRPEEHTFLSKQISRLAEEWDCKPYEIVTFGTCLVLQLTILRKAQDQQLDLKDFDLVDHLATFYQDL